MKKGRLGTMPHDYKRNGATCLFAALKFLRRLDVEFPGEVALHLVMDNYGTHKHPNVQAWLAPKKKKPGAGSPQPGLGTSGVR